MNESKEAVRKVSDELANQPKQDGAGTEEAKEKRSEAEKELNEAKTPTATT